MRGFPAEASPPPTEPTAPDAECPSDGHGVVVGLDRVADEFREEVCMSQHEQSQPGCA